MKKNYNILKDNEKVLLNYVKEDIDINDLTGFSKLLTSYLNDISINKIEKQKIEIVRNRILNLLYLMIKSDDLIEVTDLRNSFNYYARKLKSILLDNNIDLSNVNKIILSTKKDIATYVRYLKRKSNIEKILSLSNSPLDSDKLELRKLVKNERNYQRKNLKKEALKNRVPKKNDAIIETRKSKKTDDFKKRAVSMLLAGSLSVCSFALEIFSKKLNVKALDLQTAEQDVKENAELIENQNTLVEEKIVIQTSIQNDSLEANSKNVYVDKEAEDLHYICESEGINEFEFFSIVSCIAHEGGKNCYNECYDVLVSIRNRTLSALWVNDCERYTGLDGTSIYNQMIWRTPYIQYSGYRPQEAGFDKDEYIYTEAYYAAIDFFLSGEKYHEVRTHNYKSFNIHGQAPTAYPHQLNPETNGNDYYSPLKISELLISDISLDDISHDAILVRTK